MHKNKIYIVDFPVLFETLYEINIYLNYNLHNLNYDDYLKKNEDDKNSLFIIKKSNTIEKKKFDTQNKFYLNNLPIKLNKLVQKINIFFLKSVYQSNSQVNFKNYNLNLNDKIIKSDKKKLKLTEKEVKIITFLLSHKTPQKTLVLQKEIWGYEESLETHTVETHIYRLRKKIDDCFNDPDFLKKNRNGYLL
jgi:DNA-binding response OmpR family regulator